MLGFIIIFVLIYGIYIGARRGLAMQGFYSLVYLLFFLIARAVYQILGPKFELIVPYPSASLDSEFAFFSTKVGLTLDKAFYCGFAFVFICIIGWIIARFSGIYLKRLTYLPMNHTVSVLGGSILAFLTNYIGIFMILYLASLIPVVSIQNGLAHSWLATLIVKYSPILTSLFENWWINII